MNKMIIFFILKNMIFFTISSSMGGARTEAPVGFTAVFLDIFVPAILISEASEEVFTAHTPSNVSDAVFTVNIRAW